MQNTYFKRSLIAIAATILFALAVPVTVSAQSDHSREARERRQSVQQPSGQETQGQDNQSQAAEQRADSREKQEDNKLKSCQKRENAIRNIMESISERGNRQIDVFTKISDRTQTFYTDKGVTLSNYEALVAEVEAKRTAAETSVQAVQKSTLEFTCEAEDPKAAAGSVKENAKLMNAALKEYKTAVKDLIVAVKSAQSTTEKVEPSAGEQE